MLCKQHAMFYTNYCCKYFPCLWSVFQDMKRDVKWVSKFESKSSFRFQSHYSNMTVWERKLVYKMLISGAEGRGQRSSTREDQYFPYIQYFFSFFPESPFRESRRPSHGIEFLQQRNRIIYNSIQFKCFGRKGNSLH